MLGLVEGALSLPNAIDRPESRSGLTGTTSPPLADDPMQLGPFVLRLAKSCTGIFAKLLEAKPEIILGHDCLLHQG